MSCFSRPTIRAEALKSFQKVLKLDEQWAPAHLGIARTLANENPPAAAAAAEQALEIDPGYADAQLFLAELDLDNTRYDAARERIDRVLTANPSHLDARALLGAIAYVRDDKAAHEAEVAQGARDQPGVRRGVSRRRRACRRATTASTKRSR